MPDPEDVRKRLVAARTVRGYSQKEMAEALHHAGGGDFGKDDVGRIERGDLPMGPARRRALAELLAVPESWFTDEDPFDEGGDQAELDEIRQTQGQLADDLADLRGDLEKIAQDVSAILMMFRRNPPAQVRQRRPRPQGKTG